MWSVLVGTFVGVVMLVLFRRHFVVGFWSGSHTANGLLAEGWQKWQIFPIARMGPKSPSLRRFGSSCSGKAGFATFATFTHHPSHGSSPISVAVERSQPLFYWDPGVVQASLH